MRQSGDKGEFVGIGGVQGGSGYVVLRRQNMSGVRRCDDCGEVETGVDFWDKHWECFWCEGIHCSESPVYKMRTLAKVRLKGDADYKCRRCYDEYEEALNE